MNVFTPQVVALAGLDAGSAAAGAAVAVLIVLAAGLVRSRRRAPRGAAAASAAQRADATERIDSPTDEIPDGLVLLPAPPPVPRWRGVALAMTGVAFSALALSALADSGSLVRDGGDSALGGALDRSSVAFDDEVAGGGPPPSREPAATAREGSEPAPGAGAAQAREQAQSRGPDEASPGNGSAPSSGTDASESEQPQPSSESATPPPASEEEPASTPDQPGGGPAGSQPDLSQAIEDVRGVVDQVTDGIQSLPLPTLPRR